MSMLDFVLLLLETLMNKGTTMSDQNSQEPPPSLPPEPPPITDQDRGTFKERLQRILKEKDISGRRLEKEIAMATGTLSKIYQGRVALSLKMLRDIATALDVPPFQLVEGTALAHLLLGAPDSPEFAELEEARKQIDKLKAEGAEKDATINSLRRSQSEMTLALASLRKELAAAQLGQQEVEEKHTKTATALRDAEAANTKLERELDKTRKQIDTAKKVADSNKTEIERLTTDNGSKDSTIKDLQKQLAGEKKRAEEATRTAEKNASELKELKSKLSLSEKQQREAEAQASTLKEDAAALRHELEVLNANLAETTKIQDDWRNEALWRRKREAYLNAEVERLNAMSQQKESAEGIKLFLTGLGTLGLGLALGSETKRSRR